MSDVTHILNALDSGDPHAAAQLLPLVYDELRKLAAGHMANERDSHTLDATALVHEAFIKLGGERSFASRSHFLRAAGEAMRRILVDHARAKLTDKRGGERKRVAWSDMPGPLPDEDLLALDEALVRLGGVDVHAAELVQLRYFSGLSIPQAADALGIGPRSADRLWAFARAWLFRELSQK